MDERDPYAIYHELLGRRLYVSADNHVADMSTFQTHDRLRTTGVGAVHGAIVGWDTRLRLDVRDRSISSWAVEADRGDHDPEVWTSSTRGDPSSEYSRNVRHDLVAPVVHVFSTFIHSLLLSPTYPGPAERSGTVERRVIHLHLGGALLRPTTARYHRTGERTWTLELLDQHIELETDEDGVVVRGPLRLVAPPYST